MASIIQIRRDTASDWTSANPTLAQGELGLETDTLKLKAGTGTTAWNSLGYYTLATVGFLATTGGTMSGGLGMGANDITSTGKILYSNMYAQTSDLPSASTYHGMFAHVHATGKGYFAHGGAWIELANQTNLSSTTTTANAAQVPPTITGTNVTAVNASYHIASAGGITITLPASPSAGNYVTIKDGTGAAATTTFTVARNGSNIASSGTDLVFDKNFAQIVMTYINSTIGWSI